MSDLVQINFEGELFSENEQEECYIGIPAETVATIEQRVLRIKAIVAQSVIEIGEELTAIRDEIQPYKNGGFKKVVETRVGITEQYAYSLINTYEQFGKTKPGLVSHFVDKAMRLLSAPSVPQEARDKAIQRAEDGEKITVKTAKEIIEAQQAQKRAEEEAQQALAKAETAQQELFQARTESHNVVVQLSQQIEDLQKQIATISTPKKEIVEKEVVPADYAEKQKQLEKLTAEKAKLIEQRDNLSKLAKELGNDLDTLREANEAKRTRELQEARILQNWREVTNKFNAQVLQLLSQFPTPVDTQIFEAEDWERLSQAENVATRFLAECERLTNRSTSLVVDAG